MAARFFWASRAASHLRISIAQRGFASGESLSPSDSFLLCLMIYSVSLSLMVESEIVFLLQVLIFGRFVRSVP